MKIQKIQRLYGILVLSVCLLAALSLSYTVFASEKAKKMDTLEEKKVEAVLEKEPEEEKAHAENISDEERLRKEEEKKEALRLKQEEERKKIELKRKELEKEEARKKEAERREAKKKKNAFDIEMTEKDLTNLYRLVQSEVGFMDEKSKLLVASVVLNRVKSHKFPDTVSEVVLQKLGKVYQFSPVAPGKRFWTCTVSKETKAAVDKVLKNGDYSKGALYFVAKKYTTKGGWFDRNLRWLSHHKGQDYYKER